MRRGSGGAGVVVVAVAVVGVIVVLPGWRMRLLRGSGRLYEPSVSGSLRACS